MNCRRPNRDGASATFDAAFAARMRAHRSAARMILPAIRRAGAWAIPFPSAPRTRMSKRSFAILLALLVIARACLVLSLSDVFYYGEEMAKGAGAKAMLDHLGVEHYTLSYGYHEGGGFVVEHLKALAFLLAGENVLAHKLVALFTTSVLLFVGWWFASEHFGRIAGFVFGLLFVFCPASFQRFSLLDLGTHFEAMIFIVLILHFAFRIAFDASARGESAAALSTQHNNPRGALAPRSGDPPGELSRRSVRDHIAFGLSAGFGVYFSLQCLPAIACAVACIVATERRRVLRRTSLLALLAFVVGATPLWVMMSHVGMDALVVRGHELGTGTSVAEGARDLFEPLLRHGGALEWIELAMFPSLIAAGFFTTWRAARASGGENELVDGESASSAATATRLRKALVVVAYIALYMALYLGSGLAISSNDHWFFFLRLTAPWFMSIVLVGAGAEIVLARSTRLARAACRAALVVLVLGGALDVASVMSEGRPNEIASNARLLVSTKGYYYSEYFDKFVHHFDATDEEMIAVLLRYRDDPELLLPSINHSLFEHSPLGLDEVLAISKRAYGDLWLTSLKGLGPYLFASRGYNLAAELDSVVHAPQETQDVLLEAVGRTGLGLKIDENRIVKAIHAPEVPDEWRPAYLRGVGWRIHQFFRLHPERAREFIARERDADQVPLRAGFEAALAENTL